ncbi:MAG: plastocyanin/azurin family copper-binding protein [Ilumatobacter fluminis]|uniref:cupredoxin domain-containing protein n=1 Tax=Ilumatobacter fluminis TaxID=467091 RepID=UPI0032F09394
MRTTFFRQAAFVAAAAPLVLAACGDDANDAGVAARQLEARFAAAQAEPADEPADAATEVADDTDTDNDTDTESIDAADVEETAAPATTVAPVEPTGVLVPVIGLDNSFRPQVVEVNVGDEVVWENRGINEHDVLFVQDSAAPFGVEVADFQPGDFYSHVFTEPGEFRYYCSIHGNETVGMVGTVIVTG